MNKRNTKTKKFVLEIFKNSNYPLTLRDVFKKVYKHFPHTAYSTVYRIIQSMTEEKLLHLLDFKERGGRFEWSERSHHHHLICTKCGIIKDVEDSALNFHAGDVAEKTGFSINKHSIELLGLCAPCRNQNV